MSSHLNTSEGSINLGNGQPEEAALPANLISAAASSLLSDSGPPERWLQYGRERGDQGVLTALAAFLTESYGTPVSPDQLCMSSGSSHSLDLCCGALLRHGDVVLVESPGYFLAPPVFTQRGLRVVPVPSHRDGGVDPAEVEALVRAHGAKALYVVPSCNNPQGFSMPESRRRALASLAERLGFWILSDDVYQLLHFPSFGVPPPPMPSLGERVVSCSSFSKYLSPGVRVGWVHSRSREAMAAVAANGVLCSGGSTSNFAAGVVMQVLRGGGLAPYLAGLCSAYEERHEAMCEALDRHLPSAEYSRAAGGYFLFVRLPSVDTRALLARCASRVAFKTGRSCDIGGSAAHDDCVRLCFAHYPPAELREGVRRLGEVYLEAAATAASSTVPGSAGTGECLSTEAATNSAVE